MLTTNPLVWTTVNSAYDQAARVLVIIWQGQTAAPFSLMNTGAGWGYAGDFFAWEVQVVIFEGGTNALLTLPDGVIG
jgi:hypothetical protein